MADKATVMNKSSAAGKSSLLNQLRIDRIKSVVGRRPRRTLGWILAAIIAIASMTLTALRATQTAAAPVKTAVMPSLKVPSAPRSEHSWMPPVMWLHGAKPLWQPRSPEK